MLPGRAHGSATSLAGRGLVAFPKTSGSKGLQLYARLDPPWPWEEAHRTAREIAQLSSASIPGEVLSNMRRDLRAGKVLIDWSQNHAAKTTIAPYSLRALPVPSVSTPVSWDEVEQGAEGGGEGLRFLAPQVLERVEALGDLFAPLTAPAPPDGKPAAGLRRRRGLRARGRGRDTARACLRARAGTRRRARAATRARSSPSTPPWPNRA